MAKQKMDPPAWAPSAIPTERGWMDPKTKEILVSQRGLVQPIKQEEEKVEPKEKKKRGRPRKKVETADE